MRLPAILSATFAATVALLGSASASDGIALGAQAPTTTLVSIAGVDTSAARMEAILTQGEFDDCASGDGQACSTHDLAVGQRFIFQADCATGTVTDTDGERFKLNGVWGPDSVFEGRPQFREPGGRIVPVANAYRGGGLAVNYEKLCPTSARLVASTGREVAPPVRRTGAEVVPISRVTGNLFDHNGSHVVIDRDNGLIVYQDPKSSILGTVRPGQVLFRGNIDWQSMRAYGTAYTFKKGCAPAPYEVEGRWSRDGDLVLQGSAPVRAKNGCGVMGYSDRSGNARLVFVSLMSP